LTPDAPDPAQEKRDNQRPSREAQLHRLRQAGKWDRQRAECHTERDANEERDEMRGVQFLERIAHSRGGFVEVGVRADDLQLVAKLQPQSRHGGHLDVGARHPRDGYSEACVEAEFAHRLSEHAWHR
jgi:hypothetical protein